MSSNSYLVGVGVAAGVILLPWQLTVIVAVLSLMYYLTSLGRESTRTSSRLFLITSNGMQSLAFTVTLGLVTH